MKRLISEITIGKFLFNFVTDIRISSSWNEFTDTCTITIPRALEYNGKDIVSGSDALIKRGDKIEVKIGYFPNLKTEFIGFISDIKPDKPLVIECQDFMYKLKQSNIKKSYAKVNLNELLPDLLTGEYEIDFVADDINLGKFRIPNNNIVEVFEELKKTYGIYTYIQNGTLYSGLPYRTELQDEQRYHFQKNVIDSKQLIFKRAEDIRMKVKAISINKDNSRVEIETGDPDGEQKTFHFYDIPESDLEATALRELDRIKIDGYTGTFTTFGEPFLQHNDVATITDPKTPDRDGSYLVKKVDVSFGINGFRRVISLDKIVSV